MWRTLSRLLIAGWFVGMVVVAVLNREVAAQSDSMSRRYFPLMHQSYDLAVRDYIGLVRKGGDFYTVRGDSSGWQPLMLNQSIPFYTFAPWSPDGNYFLSQGENRVSLVPLATRVPRLILEGVVIHGAS